MAFQSCVLVGHLRQEKGVGVVSGTRRHVYYLGIIKVIKPLDNNVKGGVQLISKGQHHQLSMCVTLYLASNIVTKELHQKVTPEPFCLP